MRFDFEKIRQNARDLDKALDTITRTYITPDGPNTLGRVVVKESLAMADALETAQENLQALSQNYCACPNTCYVCKVLKA